MIVARTTGLAGFTPLKQTGGSNQYNQEQENKKGTKKKGFWDITQDVLDIGGFIPGVGVVLDLANAGISLGRAAFGNEEDRAYHLSNAAMSGVAAIPGLDYAAAVGKGAKKLSTMQKGWKAIKPQDPLNYMKRNPISGVLESAAGVDYTFSDMNDLVTGTGYDKSSDMGVYDPFDSSQTGKAKDRTSYLEKAMTGGIEWYTDDYKDEEKMKKMGEFFKPQIEYQEKWKTQDDKQPDEMPQHVKDFQDNMPENTLSEEEQRKIMDKAIENNKNTNAPGGGVSADRMNALKEMQRKKYGKARG